MRRVYLDHNATSPLRPEARAAMLAAMDALGNPSSVHSEGRAAKAIVEKARGQISEAFGVGAHDIVFTASATEAAALALKDRGFHAGDIEHDAIAAWVQPDLPLKSGQVCTAQPAQTALQLANSETGIVQSLPQGLGFCDMTQGFGKLPLAFSWSGADMACASAHKLGGPKGVGCLLLKPGVEVSAQSARRRSGNGSARRHGKYHRHCRFWSRRRGQCPRFK
jgi:cysteine desulfurase